MDMDADKKVMISLPIKDKTKEEVQELRDQAILDIKIRCNGKVKIVNSYFTTPYITGNVREKAQVNRVDILYIAKSIWKMATCDAVYFCKGWKKSKKCKIEHLVAKLYGLEIMNE